MLKQIKNFLIMTLSITIMAIGVYYFKFPNNFTFGGVTGAAVVFAKITPLSASMFSTIVNMLLLVVGFFFLGKGFAIKTTYATILLSVELLVLEGIFFSVNSLEIFPYLIRKNKTAVTAISFFNRSYGCYIYMN